MDRKKLETKIEQWAASLGFCLANGSAPPPNYFASLTVTRNRCRLWEDLVEVVQSRQKVQQMRKQLLAFNLKQQKKNSCDLYEKQILSKIQLAAKQKALEKEINEERTGIIMLEEDVLSRSSDVIFEMCKLAELKKQSQEYKEKALALMLLNKKEKIYVETLDKILGNDRESSDVLATLHTEELTEAKFMKTQEKIDFNSCIANRPIYHECEVQTKIMELLASGETISILWQKILARKKENFEKLSEFLQHLDLSIKPALLEKDGQVEKKLNSAISKLKQDVCLKSLQVVLTEAEGQVLNVEIDKLLERAGEIALKRSRKQRNLNETDSYLSEGDNDSFSSSPETLVQFRNQALCVEQKTYRDFLKAELLRLENLRLKRNEGNEKHGQEKEEKLQQNLNLINSILGEINKLKSEQEEQRSAMADIGTQLKELSTEISNEAEESEFIARVEDTREKLKNHLEKQTDLFVELPLEALKLEEATGKRTFSPSESASCCSTDNYSGELKAFFKSMLIQPHQSVDSALKAIEKRQNAVDEIKKFISEREKQVELEKEIYHRLMSISFDSETCEKNFKDCQEILTNTLAKASGRQSDFHLLKKLMNNWLNQPYRTMIKGTETVAGLTLSEHEEIHRKIHKNANHK